MEKFAYVVLECCGDEVTAIGTYDNREGAQRAFHLCVGEIVTDLVYDNYTSNCSDNYLTLFKPNCIYKDEFYWDIQIDDFYVRLYKVLLNTPVKEIS